MTVEPFVVCFATIEGAMPCRRRNAGTGDTCQCVEGHDGPHAAWASPDLPPYRTWPNTVHNGGSGRGHFGRTGRGQ